MEMRRLGHRVVERACNVALTFLLIAAVVRSDAQEPDPRDPVYIGFGIDRADVIVLGVFRVTWFYPWLDGWHYSGVLQVDDVLYGDHTQKERIQFRWIERYGNSCLICERVSRLDAETGIWLLARTNGALQLRGTAATLCGGPLPLDTKRTVMEALIKRKPLLAR